MKINFSTELTTLDGKPVQMSDKATDIATAARVCVEALMEATNSAEASGADKLARYQLALKIKDGGEVEITVEESSLMKELVGKMYSPLVVGQVWPLLDGHA